MSTPNVLYAKAKQMFMSPTGTSGGSPGQTVSTNINLTSDNIYAALVTASYVADPQNDQYWSSAVANVVSSPQLLTSCTLTIVLSGSIYVAVFNAAGVTFTSVPVGPAATQIVIYKNTGTTTTSPLIANIGTASGLPVTPNTGNILINWDTGTNKIFAI